MDDEYIRTTILSLFADRSPLPGTDDAERLLVPYLDMGILDSLLVVELVLSLESEFSIAFSPEDLQSEEFRTAGGLVRLISRLRSQL